MRQKPHRSFFVAAKKALPKERLPLLTAFKQCRLL
jgi:hypothetical protein